MAVKIHQSINLDTPDSWSLKSFVKKTSITALGLFHGSLKEMQVGHSLHFLSSDFLASHFRSPGSCAVTFRQHVLWQNPMTSFQIYFELPSNPIGVFVRFLPPSTWFWLIVVEFIWIRCSMSCWRNFFFFFYKQFKIAWLLCGEGFRGETKLCSWEINHCFGNMQKKKIYNNMLCALIALSCIGFRR